MQVTGPRRECRAVKVSIGAKSERSSGIRTILTVEGIENRESTGRSYLKDRAVVACPTARSRPVEIAIRAQRECATGNRALCGAECVESCQHAARVDLKDCAGQKSYPSYPIR